jgi:hypothetical protein
MWLEELAKRLGCRQLIRPRLDRSLQTLSGRAILFRVLKHLIPDRDHLGCHLQALGAISNRDRACAIAG